MQILWDGGRAPSAAAQSIPTLPARRVTVEPALPALVRSISFFTALAAPFVAALLIR